MVDVVELGNFEVALVEQHLSVYNKKYKVPEFLRYFRAGDYQSGLDFVKKDKKFRFDTFLIDYLRYKTGDTSGLSDPKVLVLLEISNNSFSSNHLLESTNLFPPALKHKLVFFLNDYKSVDLLNFEDDFKIARTLKRKFHIYVGPTNSGKTYSALQKLKSFSNGVYLSPLRLLALEKYEELNSDGVLSDLITGEEKIEVPHAEFSCRTIEMANYSKILDAAIIDEYQMVADESRGYAWTNAIVGIPAKEVFLVGSEDCLDLVIRLIERIGDTYEVTRFTRKSELLPLPSAIRGVIDLAEGDCLVAFTRNDCISLKSAVEKYTGYKCSVIYGSLSPEVRRAQAKLFQSGEAQILIATDAISMGLNLPIKRIIFTSLRKFNGKAINYLEYPHFLQIVGRAGRYGIFDAGYYGFTQNCFDDLEEVKSKKNSKVPQHFRIRPNFYHIKHISEGFGLTALSEIYKVFLVSTKHDADFYTIDTSYELAYFKLLDSMRLSLRDKFNLSLCPVDVNSDMDIALVKDYTRKNVVNLDADMFRSLLDSSLNNLESGVKNLSLYLYLNRIFPFKYPDKSLAQDLRNEFNTEISKKLLKIKGSVSSIGPDLIRRN